MQCPSCRFENMPGLDACGRCGTSLGLSTAVIDIAPPRASRTAKRVRQVVPRRLFYQTRDLTTRVRGAVTGSIVNDSHIPVPEPDVLARLIVPGWAHIHVGMKLRGRTFLGIYAILLSMGLLFWGTLDGSVLLGFAFSVHASAVMDVLIHQGTVRFPRMMALAALVSAVLAVFVYYPASQVLMRVASPIEFSADTDLFKRQDVVLVNRWAFAWRAPRRGDVVLFSPVNVNRIRASEAPVIPHVRFAYEENEVIDRLIGLPGDTVVWNNGTLAINGQAVAWKPLIPGRLPSHLEVTVPENRYLVLPTTSAAAETRAGSLGFWREGALIPAIDILGGVYLRSSPLSRFWFIR